MKVLRNLTHAEEEALARHELANYDAYELNYTLDEENISADNATLYANLSDVITVDKAASMMEEALLNRSDFEFVMFFCVLYKGVPSIYQLMTMPPETDPYATLSRYISRDFDTRVLTRIQLLRAHYVYPRKTVDCIFSFYRYPKCFQYLMEWLGLAIHPLENVQSTYNPDIIMQQKKMICFLRDNETYHIHSFVSACCARFAEVMARTYAARAALLRSLRLRKGSVAYASARHVFASEAFTRVVREFGFCCFVAEGDEATTSTKRTCL